MRLVILIHYKKNDFHTWNSLQGIRHNHWTMKYRSQWSTFILRSNVGSYWFIFRKYDVHTSNSLKDIRQKHRTVKYRSWWPTFILRSCVGSYWLFIQNNDVYTWNSLQGIRHNHWTMKYRSQWPTYKFRSNVGSYWFILRKYDVHTCTWNSLQNTGPWSIGHGDLHLFWGHASGPTDSESQIMMFIHEIVSKA